MSKTSVDSARKPAPIIVNVEAELSGGLHQAVLIYSHEGADGSAGIAATIGPAGTFKGIAHTIDAHGDGSVTATATSYDGTQVATFAVTKTNATFMVSTIDGPIAFQGIQLPYSGGLLEV
jgi:hypothetical protein